MLKNSIKNNEDDQLYFTKIFLDQNDKLEIKLDHKSEVFQNLNGATSAYLEYIITFSRREVKFVIFLFTYNFS